jgi:hypothetical protein
MADAELIQQVIDENSPRQLARRWRLLNLAIKGPAAPYMKAGRAECIPTGSKGLWYIKKPRSRTGGIYPNGEVYPSGTFTKLFRWTNSTLMSGHGECVMSDDPAELSKHLNAAMSARGRVLVTGLGLGCVLRMLQTNPRVERITLLEISRSVIDLVWPHTPHDRVELIHTDAVDFLRKTKRTWDYAWHDAWTDEDNGDPKLAVLHQWLMFLCAGRVKAQGAWAYPRVQKKALDRILPRRYPGRVREAARKIIRERERLQRLEY